MKAEASYNEISIAPINGVAEAPARWRRNPPLFKAFLYGSSVLVVLALLSALSHRIPARAVQQGWSSLRFSFPGPSKFSLRTKAGEYSEYAIRTQECGANLICEAVLQIEYFEDDPFDGEGMNVAIGYRIRSATGGVQSVSGATMRRLYDMYRMQASAYARDLLFKASHELIHLGCIVLGTETQDAIYEGAMNVAKCKSTSSAACTFLTDAQCAEDYFSEYN
ncbi:hypothetical protein FGB62_31g128 [Gracilaria domingensis]|nr:hypothetical protein FGB62_31g128 [Gracilaria domingensis]